MSTTVVTAPSTFSTKVFGGGAAVFTGAGAGADAGAFLSGAAALAGGGVTAFTGAGAALATGLDFFGVATLAATLRDFFAGTLLFFLALIVLALFFLPRDFAAFVAFDFLRVFFAIPDPRLSPDFLPSERAPA
ncbi:MAG: hypothetical protein WA652_14970 [Xanthobacteraceae bacterium]